jgi:hypothetical protein
MYSKKSVIHGNNNNNENDDNNMTTGSYSQSWNGRKK